MPLANNISEYKKIVGKRIKAARINAGFSTAADLSVLFPDWSPSRIGNYEAGVSLPNPLDLERIGLATSSSPGWLYFETGSMECELVNIQTIRHRNLVKVFNALPDSAKKIFSKQNKLKAREMKKILAAPSDLLKATLCRKIEKSLQLEKKTLDRIS